MKRFREDNTEGYTKDDLGVLNANYEARLLLMDINACRAMDDEMKSICDNVAERLLADFDSTKDR